MLQPVAWQAAPPELSTVSETSPTRAVAAAKASAVHPAEAHVVVFVHGFRVGCDPIFEVVTVHHVIMTVWWVLMVSQSNLLNPLHLMARCRGTKQILA